jgi:hypothetical protein
MVPDMAGNDDKSYYRSPHDDGELDQCDGISADLHARRSAARTRLMTKRVQVNAGIVDLDSAITSSALLEVLSRLERDQIESKVRDALAATIPGAQTEVPCGLDNCRRADIVTPTEVIEVKRMEGQGIEHAIGQVLQYGRFMPDKNHRVALFYEGSPPMEREIQMARGLCKRVEVSLTIVEVTRSGEELRVTHTD